MAVLNDKNKKEELNNTNNLNKGNNTTAASTDSSTLKGVDQGTMDKMNSTYAPSNEQIGAQTEADDARSKLKDVTNKNQIISNDVMNTLNSQFAIPETVAKADTYINSQLETIQSGKTSYSEQVRDMMAQIQGREKFSYDVNNDPLFQQALASAMNSGKTAMQDTIGQASALTGGYGSTYATTAGNQAYNAFVEDAYNNLPQYYQMAMEAHQMEGDEMYRQFDMLNSADDKEYNRNLTAYDTTFSYRNRMYDESYTQFRDAKSDAFNMANLQLAEHGQQVNDAATYYGAASDYANTQYGREYTQWSDGVNQAMQYAGMLNSDWWNQTNYDESVRQFDTNFAENQRQFDQSYQQTENWNQKDNEYRYAALAQDQRQFDANFAENQRQYNLSRGDLDGDGRISQVEQGALDKAKAGLYEGYINPDDVEVDENGNITKIDGYNIAGTNEAKSVSVNGFSTTKGDNFEVTIGDKSYKVENKGKVTDNTTIDKLDMAPSYGNIKISDNTAYLKNGNTYYKLGDLNGFLGFGTSSKSGYYDLLLELQK